MTPDELTAVADSVDGDLADRIRFLVELDRLKTVTRRSYVAGGERRENSAEHSWHLAMCAIVLAPHAQGPIDLDRVVRMLMVHDIVEIDAGDVFVYDTAAREAKASEEQAAAERIFGLLPGSAAAQLRGLWDEYEARQSPEARFAYAVDRLQPLLLNVLADGRTWTEADIGASRVLDVNRPIEDGSAELWQLAQALIAASRQRGHLRY